MGGDGGHHNHDGERSTLRPGIVSTTDGMCAVARGRIPVA